MKILREPRVYLVGRQKIDGDEIDRFLAEHELNWETDTEVGAEVLCEAAGRMCYLSYGKGRKTNQEYIHHLIEVGHGSVLEHAAGRVALDSPKPRGIAVHRPLGEIRVLAEARTVGAIVELLDRFDRCFAGRRSPVAGRRIRAPRSTFERAASSVGG